MKNLDLTALGVEEMNEVQMQKVDGGVPSSYYLDSSTIAANKNVFDFFLGIAQGFFGI